MNTDFACARVKAQLERVHLLEEIGKEWVFVRTADAVTYCSKALVQKSLDAKGGTDDGLWTNPDRLPGGVVKAN